MPYKDKEKQREFNRKRVASRRAEYLENKSCVSCGSTDNLELDHINKADKISHRIWSWSWSRILEEAAKCQVLCKDCHLVKSKACGDLITSQFTTEEISRYRQEYASGLFTSKSEMARHYRIARTTLRDILNEVSFATVPLPKVRQRPS